MRQYEIAVAQGSPHEVLLMAIACGEDLNVSLCGGSRHHVGAVALGCPKTEASRARSSLATVSVLTAYGHRDDEIARLSARKIATELGRTVCVSAGVHVDNATAEDIALLLSNCDAACKLLIARIQTDRAS